MLLHVCLFVCLCCVVVVVVVTAAALCVRLLLLLLLFIVLKQNEDVPLVEYIYLVFTCMPGLCCCTCVTSFER